MLIAVIKNSHDLPPDGVDALELRFDTLSSYPTPTLPWILTLRRTPCVSETSRFAALERLLALRPTYCDLETDTDPTFLTYLADHYPHIQWIGSHHSDDPIPTSPRRHPLFFHYKMALPAHSTLDLLRHHLSDHTNTSWISLGSDGSPSRMLGPIAGNLLNYTASLPDPSLGQIGPDLLLHTYRFHTLGPSTQLYALLGDPVSHSIGHLFHNRTFPPSTLYLKLRLTADELAPFFALAKRLPFQGYSITAPLKQAVLPHLKDLTPTARAIGAVNTIRVQNGHLFGDNTDAPASLPFTPKHLVLLGAGGAARAIAYEALQRASRLTLLNRTPTTLFSSSAQPLSTLRHLSYDLLINTIPHNKNPMPVDPEHLNPSASVLDINYSPAETPLLAAARSRGCRCYNGEAMFRAQAQLQQKFWGLRK